MQNDYAALRRFVCSFVCCSVDRSAAVYISTCAAMALSIMLMAAGQSCMRAAVGIAADINTHALLLALLLSKVLRLQFYLLHLVQYCISASHSLGIRDA
jgi:hypothetical protein